MKKLISSGYPFETEYGYSRAVRVGNQVYVSGTTARDNNLTKDSYGQTQAVLKTIAAALKEAGATLADVVRTVVYVRSMDDLTMIATAHAEAFSNVRPASTVVEVAKLTPSTARVEIEVTAIIKNDGNDM